VLLTAIMCDQINLVNVEYVNMKASAQVLDLGIFEYVKMHIYEANDQVYLMAGLRLLEI
jgi:hypothetical protein